MPIAVKEPQSDSVFPTRIQANFPIPSWFNFLGAFTSTGLLVAIVIFYLGNFGNQGFWGDETATFWQSELAYPITETGFPGLQAMFDSIRGGSADPGGFNVLLLTWINLFGATVESLRTFAFSFLLLYLLFIVILTRWLALPELIASAVIAIMLLENITPYYAFELRPYMPELAASVGFLILTLFLLERCSGLSLLAFALGTVILSASQYSAAVLSLTVGVLIFTVYFRSIKHSRSLILLAATGIAVIWPVIQYVLLRGVPLTAEQQPPTHTIDLLIRNQDFSQIVDTLSVNFLTPTALPRTIFLLLVPLLWIFGKQLVASRFTEPTRNAIGIMWLYVLIGTVFSALLSLIGVMPWTLGTRWSINEIGFIAVSLVGLTLITYQAFLEYINSKVTQIVVAFLCILVVITGSFRVATYSRPLSVDYLSSLSTELFSGSPSGLIVDNWIYDDVRYLIQYSGRYEGLQGSWTSMETRNSLGYEAATGEDVIAFLSDTSADRLLLRNLDPVGEIEIPRSVTVVELTSLANQPVLLVKNGISN